MVIVWKNGAHPGLPVNWLVIGAVSLLMFGAGLVQAMRQVGQREGTFDHAAESSAAMSACASPFIESFQS